MGGIGARQPAVVFMVGSRLKRLIFQASLIAKA
jgi:hypothetical protein